MANAGARTGRVATAAGGGDCEARGAASRLLITYRESGRRAARSSRAACRRPAGASRIATADHGSVTELDVAASRALIFCREPRRSVERGPIRVVVHALRHTAIGTHTRRVVGMKSVMFGKAHAHVLMFGKILDQHMTIVTSDLVVMVVDLVSARDYVVDDFLL